MRSQQAIVIDNRRAGRFELWRDGVVASHSAYRVRAGRLVFVRTRTATGFERLGLASCVVRAALDDVRRRGLRVSPLCPFVADFIRDHPDYADLVIDSEPPGP